MRNQKTLVYVLMVFILFFTAGCGSSSNVVATSYPTETSESITLPATVTKTSTIKPTSTPMIRNPLATLSPIDAQNLVAGLLKDNAGCRLPCWWGFTPGKSSWTEVSRFLSQLDSNIHVTGSSDALQFANVQVPTPSFVDYADELTQDFTIKEGTIYAIGIYNYDLAPAYYLSNLLADYGPPDGVFIRTLRENEDGSQPYQIDLFYEDIGIFEYSGGDPNRIDDKLQNCFEDMYSPFMYLWSPDNPMTSAEAITTFLKNDSMPDPIPLEDATDINIITFYETFINKNSNQTICLETPLDLWP